MRNKFVFHLISDETNEHHFNEDMGHTIKPSFFVQIKHLIGF